jgi:8-oxo-dGTP diphosphatase
MKQVNVAAAVILRSDGYFLLGQRGPDTVYSGYWEFPGGKVEAGETPEQALIRELDEELGVKVSQITPWLRREHVYEHAHVRLHFFRVKSWEGELQPKVHSDLYWQDPQESAREPMLPANSPILKALALPSIYAISNATEMGVAAQLAALERTLQQGLKLLQLREPSCSSNEFLAFARPAIKLCHQYGAKAILNSRHGNHAFAQEIGADGLHLTADDLSATETRPASLLISASCHNLDDLRKAEQLGLDFVVCGPVLATASHPESNGLGWRDFSQLIEGTQIPVYALGGLSGKDLLAAELTGAQGIAMQRAAWN